MPYAKRSLPIIAAILFASSAAYSQAFEVASVKAAGTDCGGKRTINSQQVIYSNFSLKGLVRDAYKIELYQVNDRHYRSPDDKSEFLGKTP